MKAAAKTLKPKRQEEQANFVSWRFALLCGCILLALGFLLGRVAWLQIIAPDMPPYTHTVPHSTRVGSSLMTNCPVCGWMTMVL